MKTKYYVMDGPDSRHLIGAVIYNNMQDAKAYVAKIPKKRAYQFGRLKFPAAYSVWENKTIISQRII